MGRNWQCLPVRSPGKMFGLSSMSVGDWALLLVGLLLVLYIVGTWNYDYFQRRGVPGTRPRIPFSGDFFKTFTGLGSFSDCIQELYNRGKGHGVFGVFEIVRPIFMIRDPELVKIVSIKEFDSFINHRSFANEKVEPVFAKNLFNLKNQTWRDMRATLSPAFTTNKIKVMIPLISQCAEQMSDYLVEKYKLSKEATSKEPLETDIKDLFTRMANDVIATAAFGLSCNSLKNPENEFYRQGKALTTLDKFRALLFFLSIALPKLLELTRIRVLNEKAIDFFCSLVHETISERQQKGIVRPDVLQLLMQAREGQLKADTEDAHEAEDADLQPKARAKLSDDDLSAQAMIFFFAGFETVSAGICFATYALSHNPDVQQSLQAEIDEVMEKNAGKITYEAIQSMKYLDAVVNESLRMFPLAPVVDRVCEKDIVLPAGEMSSPVRISKGTLIHIPIIGLHLDPMYWEEPNTFNPNRFLDEEKKSVKPFCFMPFGVGPRICVAQRFALIEVKLALIHLLSSFDLHPSPKVKYPIEYASMANLSPKGGFWCGLTPRAK